MLAYLGRRGAHLPLLLVISTRDSGSLHHALRELVDHAHATVSLGPLTVEDLESGFPDADLPTVIEATGGIPLLVQEALATGEVKPDSSSVMEYIDSRRRRLSDLPAQVLAQPLFSVGLRCGFAAGDPVGELRKRWSRLSRSWCSPVC